MRDPRHNKICHFHGGDFSQRILGNKRIHGDIYLYIYRDWWEGWKLREMGSVRGRRGLSGDGEWWRRCCHDEYRPTLFPCIRFCFNIFPHRAVIDPHHSLNWMFDSLPPINRINRLFFFYSIGFVESTRKCIPFFFFFFSFLRDRINRIRGWIFYFDVKKKKRTLSRRLFKK